MDKEIDNHSLKICAACILVRMKNNLKEYSTMDITIARNRVNEEMGLCDNDDNDDKRTCFSSKANRGRRSQYFCTTIQSHYAVFTMRVITIPQYTCGFILVAHESVQSKFGRIGTGWERGTCRFSHACNTGTDFNPVFPCSGEPLCVSPGVTVLLVGCGDLSLDQMSFKNQKPLSGRSQF